MKRLIKIIASILFFWILLYNVSVKSNSQSSVDNTLVMENTNALACYELSVDGQYYFDCCPPWWHDCWWVGSVMLPGIWA